MAIITLTSDIGTKDYLPGAVKGRLLSVNPAFTLCDITHDLSPFSYNEAVYIIRSSFPNFPEHTWHLLLINLLDTPDARLLLAFHKGHYFICADNGLLPMIFDGMPDQVIVLSQPKTKLSNVFTLIDNAAKAIKAIDNGAAFHKLGKETDDIVIKHNLKPIFKEDSIEGRIIHIDRFKNVVVNVTQDEFEQARRGRAFIIRFKGDEKITALSNSYADVAEGAKLAFFNAAGYLEIAVNKGNAAELFGLHIFEDKISTKLLNARMYYHTVTILFDDAKK